ncbi:MAG: DinB family protein [Bryobacterales bacterium]|nr:DinB family protein [Bryobacterales bacterium]MBV9398802.1 DinB family protein [Bryobacterales bacterium]
MTPEERIELIPLLEASREEFLDAASGISEAQASAKPGPGKWSVLECVEHVATVEERFLKRLETAPRSNAPRVDKQKELDLAARVPDRTVRAEAPEPARPTGRFASLAEAMDRFNANRAQTIRFAKDSAAELYWLSLDHPRFGPMNGSEFMVVIASHARRHAAQIRETKTALGIV